MRDEQTDLLIQQYEEVALGLLMEEYANAEGKRLLQEFETASAQGDIEPMPEDLKSKYHQLIDQAYKKKRQRKLFSGITKTVGKVAVVALMLFGIATTAILSVDAWRVPVLNFILDQSGEFAFVNVDYNNSSLENQYKAIVKTVCDNAPPDYTLTETPVVDDPSLLVKMKNSEGKKLTVSVRRETNQIQVDTEDAQVKEMDLNGKPAFLILEEGIYVIWHDNVKGLLISVYAQDRSLDAFWALVYALAE